MKARAITAMAIVGATCYVTGCSDIKMSPRIIEADGTTYAACSGLVWVTSDGGLLGGSSSFDVSFTDAQGIGHVLRGVKKVGVSEVPDEVYAPMAPNPDDTFLSATPTSPAAALTIKEIQDAVENGRLGREAARRELELREKLLKRKNPPPASTGGAAPDISAKEALEELTPIEGAIYSWADGSKAKYQSGQWEPVKVPNPVCQAS